MLKGFRDFIIRGNVVELAVGFVMGVAFSGMVTQLTRSFLEPMIKWVSGGRGVTAGAIQVREGVAFDWAAFINAVVTFLLTAAILYFLVVMPTNKLAERRKRGEEPPPEAPSEEVQLLTEIRDLLANSSRVPPAEPLSGAAAARPLMCVNARANRPPALGGLWSDRAHGNVVNFRTQDLFLCHQVGCLLHSPSSHSG